MVLRPHFDCALQKRLMGLHDLSAMDTLKTGNSWDMIYKVVYTKIVRLKFVILMFTVW